MSSRPSPPACQAYSPQYPSAYGYRPSLAAGIIFVTLYFLSASTHLIQAIRYKTLWQGLFVIGAGAECLGWIARTAASQCVYSEDLFIMQISILIFSPAFTMAGIYIILFKTIPILGSKTCPFPAKPCLWTCLIVDLISLILQAVGGGIASAAPNASLGSGLAGTYTMAAGILFQLSATLTYAALMGIVFVRGFAPIRASEPLRGLAGAVVLAVACMIARGVYRSVELLQGWEGKLNMTEGYLIALDGALMVLAVLVLNVWNPGKLLKRAEVEKERRVEREEKGAASEEASKRSSESDNAV